MWSETVDGIRSGNIDPDPTLSARLPDARRGLTVIARPGPAVRRAVSAFLGELECIEPDQHYYSPSELHLTVLSLFTATVAPEAFFARARDYLEAVDAALNGARLFEVTFEGVTASRSAIMVQGFPGSDALNNLRDSLRAQLRSRGIGDGLDKRYRLETAHLTVARFRAPLREPWRFAGFLEEARQHPFGTSRFSALSLVENDWYMSRRITKTIKRHSLQPKRLMG